MSPPTYAAVAIVKNEAERIDTLLDSIAPHVTTATFVDTGSTDDTVARIEARGYQVHRRAWVNFGTNRSEAFALARGTADWLLALDADFTVEIDPDFSPDPAVDAYMLTMGRGTGFEHRLPLLLRGDVEWKSVGPVHEYTARVDGREYAGVPTDQVRVTYSDGSSPAKTRLYAQLLEDALAADPNDARTVFYLAQSYRELGRPEALNLYQRRAGMGGYAEEAFYAAYRAGLLTPWPEQAAVLLAAWEQRPPRLEPLHALISELNRRGLHQAAYRLCVTTPVPDDRLFIHRGVWDWGMDFERSIAAWWIGQREEFEHLTVSLLANPRLPADIRAQVVSNAALEAA